VQFTKRLSTKSCSQTWPVLDPTVPKPSDHVAVSRAPHGYLASGPVRCGSAKAPESQSARCPPAATIARCSLGARPPPQRCRRSAGQGATRCGRGQGRGVRHVRPVRPDVPNPPARGTPWPGRYVRVLSSSEHVRFVRMRARGQHLWESDVQVSQHHLHMVRVHGEGALAGRRTASETDTAAARGGGT